MTSRQDTGVVSPIPGRALPVIRNGIDVVRFAPRPRDRNFARRLGIHKRDMVVGCVTAFSHYEGIEHLIRATSLLAPKSPRLRTLIIGDGKRRNWMVQLARTLGVADRVVFAGPVLHSELHHCFDATDIFVLPRRWDPPGKRGLPVELLEAVASGCTLALSDTPALREFATESETGLLVAPQNAEALARTLDELIRHTTIRVELGLRGRRWVVANRNRGHAGRTYTANAEILSPVPLLRNRGSRGNGA